MSVLPYPAPQSADEFFAWSVAEGARNPGNWIADADALMASAQLVLAGWRKARLAVFSAWMSVDAAEQMRQHRELWAADVFMMLAGMAFEDLLKAVIITRAPNLVRPNPAAPTQMLDSSMRHHDLERLAIHAGIPLDADKRGFLSRLSSFIQWAGRYPLATTLGAMASAPGNSDLRPVEDPKDPESVDALYERVRAIAWQVQIDEYAARQQETERLAAREARRRVERWLEDNANSDLLDDGTARYVAHHRREESGAAIACCSCGTTLQLDGTTRAATCGCATLYFLDWVFCGGDAPSAHTWSFNSEDDAGP